jgi:Peptidase family M28
VRAASRTLKLSALHCSSALPSGNMGAAPTPLPRMNLHRSLLAALLACTATLPALAQEAPALERGFAGIDAASISSDLHFLASDALRGRDTPSPELQVAAMYLRNRVQRLGFEPGAENGWFYEYPLYRHHLDAEASSLSVQRGVQGDGERIEFGFGEDYYLQRSTHIFDFAGEATLVSAGSGSRKEFAEGDVAGKWVIFAHGGRPLGPVVRRAEKAGALGLIATPAADYSRDSYAKKYTKSVARMLEGRATPTQRETKPMLPQVMLTRDAAKRLFAAAGLAAEADFPVAGTELEVRVQEVRRAAVEIEPIYNVCAFWPGSDPLLAGDVMIVSAHYDHVGERDGEIYNGADDNGSGTSGVLALADALAAYGPLKRSVLLLWVSGEEKGLWGSAAWTKAPWLPGGCKPVLDINIDMIGRTEADELYITPTREHDAFNDVAETAYELSALEGFPELQSQDDYWRRSDHMNFNDNLGVPVVFLSSGEHPDYHKPSDTPDKIDYEKLARTVRLVLRMLDELQEGQLAQ